MKSFIKRIYFSREKEENIELQDIADSEGFNLDLSYTGYEVEMEVEFFENGSNKVLKINEIDISDKNISI